MSPTVAASAAHAGGSLAHTRVITARAAPGSDDGAGERGVRWALASAAEAPSEKEKRAAVREAVCDGDAAADAAVGAADTAASAAAAGAA